VCVNDLPFLAVKDDKKIDAGDKERWPTDKLLLLLKKSKAK
jgi:hypothetical protein